MWSTWWNSLQYSIKSTHMTLPVCSDLAGQLWCSSISAWAVELMSQMCPSKPLDKTGGMDIGHRSFSIVLGHLYPYISCSEQYPIQYSCLGKQTWKDYYISVIHTTQAITLSLFLPWSLFPLHLSYMHDCVCALEQSMFLVICETQCGERIL